MVWGLGTTKSYSDPAPALYCICHRTIPSRRSRNQKSRSQLSGCRMERNTKSRCLQRRLALEEKGTTRRFRGLSTRTRYTAGRSRSGRKERRARNNRPGGFVSELNLAGRQTFHTHPSGLLSNGLTSFVFSVGSTWNAVYLALPAIPWAGVKRNSPNPFTTS